MLFSLACLAGFLTVVCTPGLVALELEDRRARKDEAA